MEHTKHILEARNLYKHFNEFIAVDGVSFKVKRGGIHALIGPNGAGKTTCFNLLTGFLKPDKGCISFNGHVITATPPEELAQRGLVRSFQISSVFSRMNVLENIQMALLAKEHGYWCFWRSQKILEKYNERAFELLTEVGLEELAHSMAGGLPYGKKTRFRARYNACFKTRAYLIR